MALLAQDLAPGFPLELIAAGRCDWIPRLSERVLHLLRRDVDQSGDAEEDGQPYDREPEGKQKLQSCWNPYPGPFPSPLKQEQPHESRETDKTDEQTVTVHSPD
jgi:hypothetical protein